MHNSLSIFLRRAVACFLLISCLAGCEKDENIEPAPHTQVEFTPITGNPAFLAYQVGKFDGNYPGAAEDYQMFFGTEEIPVDEVTNTHLRFVVPYEMPVGEHRVKLIYKNKEHALGRVIIKDWRTQISNDIGYFEMDDPEYPVHVRDSMNNSLIPHVSEDGSIDHILFTSGEGVQSVIELNDMGLPAMLYNETETMIFDGYDLEKGTVNVAMISNQDLDEVAYSYVIQLNKEALAVATSYKERMSGGRIGSGGRIQSGVGDALGVVTTVFSITGCIVGSAAMLTPLSAPLGFALATANCGSAIYSAYRTYESLVNGDSQTHAVDVANAVYGNTSALYGCAMLTTKPKNVKEIYDGFYGCYTLVLEAIKGVDHLYDEFKNANADALARHKAILSSGYGDIKVTLTWDTHADIDLWVNEPGGATIKWDSPSSPNNGELDLDDTNGLGPENIFWPRDMAPLGTYNVKVHYYGSESEAEPITTYSVIVVNFGVSRTFTGTLQLDQVASVVVFEAGGWAGPDPGRTAGPVIVDFDASKIPRKK